MSIWDRFIRGGKIGKRNSVAGTETAVRTYNPSCYAIVDVEVGLRNGRIHDVGDIRHDGAIYHNA